MGRLDYVRMNDLAFTRQYVGLRRGGCVSHRIVLYSIKWISRVVRSGAAFKILLVGI